jgi:hypothetical protein
MIVAAEFRQAGQCNLKPADRAEIEPQASEQRVAVPARAVQIADEEIRLPWPDPG